MRRVPGSGEPIESLITDANFGAGTDARPFEICLLGLLPELGAANRLTVGPFHQRMPDQAFARLVRLVVARLESDDGFVDGDELVRVGRFSADVFGPNEVNKAAKAIRDPLFPFFGDRIVEVHRGCARLDPDVAVTWDRERLTRHPNQVISGLAEKLPSARPTQSSPIA